MFNVLQTDKNRSDDKPDIMFLRVLGDSLSDRNFSSQQKICFCIPMSWLTGLYKTSPRGRFGNGYIWSDNLAMKLGGDFGIRMIQKHQQQRAENNLLFLDSTDIADAALCDDAKFLKFRQTSYCRKKHKDWSDKKR